MARGSPVRPIEGGRPQTQSEWGATESDDGLSGPWSETVGLDVLI